MTEANAE